jgi:hypothetical protein
LQHTSKEERDAGREVSKAYGATTMTRWHTSTY